MLRASAAVLLLPLVVSGDSPRLAYSEGTEVTRTWTLESIRTTDSVTLVINGNEQDVGSGATNRTAFSAEITDQILAAEDGAPSRFMRTYESVDTDSAIEDFEAGDGMQIRDGSGSSELVGASVLFDWNADAEEWKRSYDEDSAGDDDWLDDLDADMDLADVLPADEVEVGDSWEVPVSLLDTLLRPGGEIDVRDDESEAPEGAISIQIPNVSDFGRWGELDGTIEATYTELVEEDGPRIARIVLDIDVDGEIDVIDELEENSADRGSEDDYTEAQLTRELKGKITIDWDLEAGYFVALEGDLEGTSEFYGAWTISAQGFEIDLEVERAEEFDYEIKASIE